MSFWLWAGAILIAFVAFTFLIKRFKNAQTYYIASIIKTKRGTALIERIAGLGRVWDVLADIGLVMGFGAIAVDFRFGKKYKMKKRCALFAASVILLSLLFYFISSPFFSNNPFVGNFHAVFALSFGFMGLSGFAIMILVSQAADIIPKLIAGKKACPGIAPVIPGVQIPNVPVFVPLHAWISFLIILVLHEGFHGVLMRRAGLAIKSVGLILVGFLPIGAFVEPDEAKLKKAVPEKQLGIYAAGSLANLLSGMAIWLIVLAFAVFVISPLISPWADAEYEKATLGVVIAGIDQNAELCGEIYDNPAYGVLEKGMQIIAVNGKPVSRLADYMNEVGKDRFAAVELEVIAADGTQKSFTLNPNRLGMLGFYLQDMPNPAHEMSAGFKSAIFAINLLLEFFGWLILLSILVAIVNFLPVVPFDGGRMAILLFAPYLKGLKMSEEQTQKLIARFFIWLVGILILLNAIPLFL